MLDYIINSLKQSILNNDTLFLSKNIHKVTPDVVDTLIYYSIRMNKFENIKCLNINFDNRFDVMEIAINNNDSNAVKYLLENYNIGITKFNIRIAFKRSLDNILDLLIQHEITKTYSIIHKYYQM